MKAAVEVDAAVRESHYFCTYLTTYLLEITDLKII